MIYMPIEAVDLKQYLNIKNELGGFMRENNIVNAMSARILWLAGLFVLLGLVIAPASAATNYINSDMLYNGSNVICNPGDTLKFGAGGRIRVPSGKTLTLNGCTVDLTGGPNDMRGILVKGGSLVLTNTTVKGAKKEGAIRIIDGGKVTITGGQFLNNTSVKGGAILIQDKSTLTIDGGTLFQGNKSTFENTNYERSGGGAICAEDSTVTIYDAVFDGNTAVSNGGAIAHDGGSLILGKTDVKYDYVNGRDAVRPRFVNNSAGNTARAKGGAVAVEIDCKYNPSSGNQGEMKDACQKSVKGMTLTINNAVFDKNTAVYQGGALAAGYGMKGYWTSNHTTTKETNVLVDIKKAAFTNNKVTNNTGDNVAGGAMVIQTNAKVMMKDAAFVGNTASNAGGAIASCLWGANQISLVEGAAIFDNKAASWTNGKSDVYVMNVTDQQYHPSKFSVRMFTGALHNWTYQDNVEKRNSCNPNDAACQQVCPGGICKGVFQGSAPKDKEISGENNKKAFQVLFQGNSVASDNSGNMVLDRGNGGAIGNNGALNIGGSDEEVTSIDLEKIWVNDQNVWKSRRPEPAEFLEKWLKVERDDELYDFGKITAKGECTSSPSQAANMTTYTCLYDTEKDPNVMITLIYDSDDSGYSSKWSVSIDGLDKSEYVDSSSSVHFIEWDVYEDVQEHVTLKVEGKDQVYDVYVKQPARVQDPKTGVYTFTNEFNLVSIEGEKTWDQELENLPDSISVHLHDENNNRIGESITVIPDQDGKWTWKFEPLPKFRKTSENTYVKIDYWVHEEKINNWDSESDRAQYVMGTDTDPLKYTNFNILNKHNPNGDVIIEVIKAWDDKDDRDGKRNDAEFTVALFANGVPFYPDGSGVQLTKTLNKDNNWNVRFTGLPEKNSDNREITYTVKENDSDNGYKWLSDETETIYAPDRTTITGYILKNQYEPKTVTLSVTKKWDDDRDSSMRPGGDPAMTDEERITDIVKFLEHIRLFRKADGATEALPYRLADIVYVPETEYQFTAKDRLGQETFEITVKDNLDDTWTISCSGLPRYESGKELAWYIKEDRIQNYTPMNVPEEGLSGTCSGEDDNRNCTYEVTNDLDVTTATLTKIWDDGGHDDTRPEPRAFLESLRLYRSVTIDGETKTEFLEHGDFTVEQDPLLATSYNFTISAYPHITGTLVKNDGEDVWTVYVNHLPKRDANRNAYTWTLEESLGGYQAEINNEYQKVPQITITNKPVVDIHVSKIWMDDIEDPEPVLVPDGEEADPVEGGHPAVTVTLQPNGQTLTLTAEGHWRGVFRNLPKYDESGNEIKYTVEEAVPEGYKMSKLGTAADSRVIFINTKLIDIPVRKVWSDDPKGEKEHPEISVSLTVNGEPASDVAPLVLNADNGWKGQFSELPMFDAESGEKINYSVQENGKPAGYDRVSIRTEEDGTIVVTNSKKERPFKPFFPIEELPKTGFSALRPTALAAQPHKLSYSPSGLTLMIPSLDVSTAIVTVPYTDGNYPVEWLGNQAGLLEGSAVPGEGFTVLTGHNHLNTMEAGPFAFLSALSKGDMVFVVDEAGALRSFKVNASVKIAADDSTALERLATAAEGTLTLLTCEDETPEGAYANRRVITAVPWEIVD